MSVEDQKKWEMEEMAKPIDLKAASISIDPAPFQLVEKTSILKVHSLFSMVGINHAYVTKIGRLVGVVALKEVSNCNLFQHRATVLSFVFGFQLRKAIEDVNSGNMQASSTDADDLDTSAPTVNGVSNADATDANAIMSEKAVLAAQEQPLLGNNNSNYNNNHVKSSRAPLLRTVDDETITSNDSTLSNSDNCSDLEMPYIDDPTTTTMQAVAPLTLTTETETGHHTQRRQSIQTITTKGDESSA